MRQTCILEKLNFKISRGNMPQDPLVYSRLWRSILLYRNNYELLGAVSGSDCRILKFLRTAFLAAKLLGWKVGVKGIRSSLSEADGSKADSLLTFWTRLSALDKMLSG